MRRIVIYVFLSMGYTIKFELENKTVPQDQKQSAFNFKPFQQREMMKETMQGDKSQNLSISGIHQVGWWQFLRKGFFCVVNLLQGASWKPRLFTDLDAQLLINNAHLTNALQRSPQAPGLERSVPRYEHQPWDVGRVRGTWFMGGNKGKQMIGGRLRTKCNVSVPSEMFGSVVIKWVLTLLISKWKNVLGIYFFLFL